MEFRPHKKIKESVLASGTRNTFTAGASNVM